MGFHTMNGAYVELVNNVLNLAERKSTSRKGEKLFERMYNEFTLYDPFDCLATYRPGFSLNYLRKEFDFYCSGSDKLEDAVKLSKFWKKCSDDGETITSNYGKLLLHDRNAKGKTQFEHVVDVLKNNVDSKKAVMAVYSPEHAFISNDNPCTMFLHFYIADDRLFLKTHMRSNDAWFGVVYDVPFFCAVQYAVYKELKETYPKLLMGYYTHYACSMHVYGRNEEELRKMIKDHSCPTVNSSSTHSDFIRALFSDVHRTATQKSTTAPKMSYGMACAWDAAKGSNCLKKKCGAALIFENAYPEPRLCSIGYGGRVPGSECKTCARDAGEKFHGDGCWSVHAEMRAIMDAIRQYGTCVQNATMYVTHGPCDACMKLMDFVGIKKVVYDVPYKTDYSHWPRIQVIREAVTPESVEKGKSEKGKGSEGDMPECFGKYPTSWEASCYNCKVDVLCLVTSAYGRK